MSEPLDSQTLARLAYTEQAKKHVRMVDMPVVALPLNGTLHARARPVYTLPTRRCSICGNGFWPRLGTQTCCGVKCRNAARAKGTGKKPLNVRTDHTRAVAAVCAAWTGVTAGEIFSDSREHPIVRPRQAAYALIRELRPDASLCDIGRAFKRDHSTVLNGIRKHEARMAEPEYAERFEAARALIRSAIP